MTDRRRVLNLGAGTQSSVLYFLMCEGKVEPAEVALFSDLGWEPRAVYEHLDWMERQGGRVPIVRVKSGDIRRDALASQVRGKVADGGRWASMPLYTWKLWTPDEAEAFEATFLAKPTELADEWSLFGSVVDEGSMLYMRQLADLRRGRTVEHRGMIRRQCTTEYKINPLTKWVRENVLGLKHKQRSPREPVIDRVMGISFDERQRMKLSRERWAENVYPLVDMRWRRAAVIRWAEERFPERTFPRSACLGCPYHSNAEWREIRQRPDEWADVVTFDRAIRNCGGMRGEMFLHRDCVPTRWTCRMTRPTGTALRPMSVKGCVAYDRARAHRRLPRLDPGRLAATARPAARRSEPRPDPAAGRRPLPRRVRCREWGRALRGPAVGNIATREGAEAERRTDRAAEAAGGERPWGTLPVRKGGEPVDGALRCGGRRGDRTGRHVRGPDLALPDRRGGA
jgi:hypothetical protein